MPRERGLQGGDGIHEALERTKRGSPGQRAEASWYKYAAALLARAQELFPRAETELPERCMHCPPVDDAVRARTAARVATFLARR